VSSPEPAEAVRAAPVTVEQIRAAIEAHEPEDGYKQWYVDELCIDCDAAEFWAVVAAALEKQ
jgi:hypothetical protein